MPEPAKRIGKYRGHACKSLHRVKGAQQLFSAVGTFNDGSTASLASVLWSSSNTTVAAISNDATDSGAAASLTQGAAT